MIDARSVFTVAFKKAASLEKGFTLRMLEGPTGLSNGRLSEYFSGKRIPGPKIQAKIVAAMGYNLVDFLALAAATEPVTNAGPNIPLAKVPLFDAGAGEPSEFFLNNRAYDLRDDDDFIYVTEHEAKMGAFGVKVHGNSMAPAIEQGNIVVVMPTRTIENGRVVLACWPAGDGDAGKRLVKRYKADSRGNVVLYSDNTDHEPIILDRKADKDVQLFRVVKLVKDL